jgi:hypothetical protein
VENIDTELDAMILQICPSIAAGSTAVQKCNQVLDGNSCEVQTMTQKLCGREIRMAELNQTVGIVSSSISSLLMPSMCLMSARNV